MGEHIFSLCLYCGRRVRHLCALCSLIYGRDSRWAFSLCQYNDEEILLADNWPINQRAINTR